MVAANAADPKIAACETAATKAEADWTAANSKTPSEEEAKEIEAAAVAGLTDAEKTSLTEYKALA